MYRKVLYREYTNARFSRQVVPKPSRGMLGPTLRAETGDTIVVVFKNMAMSANRSFSVHPHGVQYNKSSEGEKDDVSVEWLSEFGLGGGTLVCLTH